MGQIVSIGVGELAVSSDPEDVLITYALGSCLGVVVYDVEARVGGLLHAVLPFGGNIPEAVATPGRYVDLGIMELFGRVMRKGGQPRRAIVRLTGGANILASALDFEVGKRNAQVARRFFQKNQITIVSEHTGGDIPRTVSLDIATGLMTIRSRGRVTEVPVDQPEGRRRRG